MPNADRSPGTRVGGAAPLPGGDGADVRSWRELEVPLAAVPGIGPALSRRLATAGLRTVADALRHLPRRYEDRGHVPPIALLRPAPSVTVSGTVVAVRAVRPHRGIHLLHARLQDATGELEVVWFNQPYLTRTVRPGVRLYATGRLEHHGAGLRLVAPEIERADAMPPPDAERLIPVYPLWGGMGQRSLRRLIRAVVDGFAARTPEVLPPEVRVSRSLAAAPVAWHDIHFPPDTAARDAARRRLVFEECLLWQLGLGLRRRHRARATRPFRYTPPGKLTRTFLRSLSYELTAAQRRVLAEIEADLGRSRPMYRLLQGDVGSGKTVVATLALLRAIESGRQGALMAPTEILAEQHYRRLERQLATLDVHVALVSGGLGAADRERALAATASGEAELVIGTHALIQDTVRFHSLGLVVTDEQHRFGVRQRDRLAAKGDCPDVLALSATPIPRTLTLTLYGDLDVSRLDEPPPGRRPVRTYWRRPQARRRVYAFVRDQIGDGRQAYVVCPRILDAGTLDEDAGASDDQARDSWGEGDAGVDGDAVAAASWAERLRRTLPGIRIALLHGRLAPAEKDSVMRAFAAHAIDLLVTTTVVEVGIDVANATIMVIEGAEHFGLAQLHQLRGRVGRGPRPSFCILIADPKGDEEERRLDTFTRITDGFAIAREDLRLRGPGELLGTRQHGLPGLAVTDLARDLPLLEAARDEAARLASADPTLEGHPLLLRAVEDLFGTHPGWEG